MTVPTTWVEAMVSGNGGLASKLMLQRYACTCPTPPMQNTSRQRMMNFVNSSIFMMMAFMTRRYWFQTTHNTPSGGGVSVFNGNGVLQGFLRLGMVMLERSTGLQFCSDAAEPLTMRGTAGVKVIWGSPTKFWFAFDATPQPEWEHIEKA